MLSKADSMPTSSSAPDPRRDDVPRMLRGRTRLVTWACAAIVVAAALSQVVDVDPREGDTPWLPLALVYLSSAAIGIDAVVVGVRKKRGVGPSIANLAPGGWAFFAATFWILAVPAYYVGARRLRARDEDPREPVGLATWATIGAVLALSMFCAVASFAR